MTLGTAVLMLALVLIGIVLAHKYLRKKRAAYIFCVGVADAGLHRLYWVGVNSCRCDQKPKPNGVSTSIEFTQVIEMDKIVAVLNEKI